MFALNEIVGGYGMYMNISGVDLTSFLYCVDWIDKTLKRDLMDYFS